MKLNTETWKAQYKTSLEDLQKAVPTTGASDGIVCALATLRYVRNAITEEEDGDKYTGPQDSINELIKQITSSDAPSLAGFASNASAAAAACKLKGATSSAIVSGLSA